MKSPSDLDCRLASWQTEHLHSLWKLSKPKHHSCQKDIRAVRKLPSGDIIISLETPQAKAQLESNKEWISTVFTAEAKLSPRIFPVLVHGVQTKDFKPENLEETKRAIFSQNFGMESKVTILKAYWCRKAKLLQKPVTSLHLDLATPE